MAEDQGIVRDARGQEQPKDKMRAQPHKSRKCSGKGAGPEALDPCDAG